MFNMRKPAVRLPIDIPLVIKVGSTHATNRGLAYQANLGFTPSPIRKPYTQWDSKVWPFVKGTNVSPDAIKPKFGYSTNDYSPSFHRSAETTMVPATKQTFKGKANGLQRVTGKNVPWPFAQPSYAALLPGVNQ